MSPAAPGATGHTCTLDDLDRLAPPVTPGGILLGRDPEHRTVLVPLFQPRPVRFVVIGGAWPSRLLLLRALAVGARVLAAPSQPDWVSLGRWATGTDWWVLPPGSPVPPGHPAAPMLISVDPGPHPLPVPGPWQAVVGAVPRPSEAVLSGADLLLTARLSTPDADLVSSRFGLDHEASRLISRLYDDMIAVIEPGRVRYAWPTPSNAELEILAPPAPTAAPSAPPPGQGQVPNRPTLGGPPPAPPPDR